MFFTRLAVSRRRSSLQRRRLESKTHTQKKTKLSRSGRNRNDLRVSPALLRKRRHVRPSRVSLPRRRSISSLSPFPSGSAEVLPPRPGSKTTGGDEERPSGRRQRGKGGTPVRLLLHRSLSKGKNVLHCRSLRNLGTAVAIFNTPTDVFVRPPPLFFSSTFPFQSLF